jgi:hypothetical protein
MHITVSLIVDIPASADINEIEQRVQEAWWQAVRAAEEQRKTCPYCGSEASRSQGTDRRIIPTKFGRGAVPLRRQRCRGCGRRFRPADACLKGLQGGNVTAALREACSKAGSSSPSRATFGSIAVITAPVSITSPSSRTTVRIFPPEASIRATGAAQRTRPP